MLRPFASISTLALAAILSACAPLHAYPPLNQHAATIPVAERPYPQPTYIAPVYSMATPAAQPSPKGLVLQCNNGINFTTAIVGGVLGGLVGAQFGKGNGRTGMGIVGATGGALAGNAVGCQ